MCDSMITTIEDDCSFWLAEIPRQAWLEKDTGVDRSVGERGGDAHRAAANAGNAGKPGQVTATTPAAPLIPVEQPLLGLGNEFPRVLERIGLAGNVPQLGLGEIEIRLGVAPHGLGARLELRLVQLGGLGPNARIGGHSSCRVGQ